MYEDGIDVVYEAASYDDQGRESWGPQAKVTLPGWCAGDPEMALSLYLFGRRDCTGEINVVDWQPHEDADEDDEPFPSDRELARQAAFLREQEHDELLGGGAR